MHRFDGEEFTRSAEAFKAQVGTLKADGGGPIPESSYDALVKATEMDWPQGCEKVILLITDAPSHTSTTTKDAAYAAMEAAEVEQFYGLTYTTKPNVRDCYLDFVKIGKGRTCTILETGPFNLGEDHPKHRSDILRADNLEDQGWRHNRLRPTGLG